MVLIGLLALLVAGCGEPEPTDDVDEPDEQVEQDDDADGDDEGHAEATWDGEQLAFDRVSCRSIGESYALTAFGDGYELQTRFPAIPDADDPLNPDFDYDRPSEVSLFFHGDNGTIGDGEGYEARGEELEGTVDSGEVWSEGSVHLGPDSHSGAEEINPDGGTLEFEMRC